MSHRILVVDDEPMLLELIATILRLDGHTVTEVGDPLKAEDCFSNGTIDLIITDVTLKPITGFEMVKRLNVLGFNGQVLFMSGYSNLSGAISQSIGTQAVLDKPFTALEPRKAVKRALSSARTQGKRLDTDFLVA